MDQFVSSLSDSQNRIKDIVVIGGGLMGSSTAWHLSNQNKNVLLVEQQELDYTAGSSFGESRIVRSLGPDKDIFSYLHNRSVSETEKLIFFLNKQEKSNDHQMEDIYTTSPVTYIYDKSRQSRVNSLLQNQNDSIEYAGSAKEASKKFGMSLPEATLVLREYKKYSGTLNPKELIKKLHTGIEKYGNFVRYNHQVTALKKKGDIFEIELAHTKTGDVTSILSKKVVSSVGPYTGRLLKKVAPQFDKLISPKRTFLVFLKIDPQKFAVLTADQKQKIEEFYPVLDFTSDLMYSMIDKIDGDGVPILKIGGHLIRKKITNLDDVWQTKLSDDEKKWGLQTTIKYLQQLNIPLKQSDLDYIEGYSCVYSMTDTEVPLVTNILDEKNQPDPNIVVLGGMSGVGAKGAMAYGLMGANLLLQKEEESEMYQFTKNLLSIERFPDRSEKNSSQSSWLVSDQ